jgi:1-acyl-sn-glycerol-3-phosphate acyltransferase
MQAAVLPGATRAKWTPARAWRALRTGFCFGTFGALCLFLGLAVFPLVQLRGGDAETRERRCQRWVARIFGWFTLVLRGTGVAEIHIRGAEQLQKPGQLLVANHPTLLDVVLIGAQLPQLDCVVKKEAWANPFMGRVVRATGYVPNDLGESVIEACAERLRRGRSLLLFPEGTRSPAGELGPFMRGAAHLALRSGRALTPIVVRCTPPTLMRGQKWYDVPNRRMRFEIEVCAPIAPESATEPDEPRSVAARRLTSRLRDFYLERLHS